MGLIEPPEYFVRQDADEDDQFFRDDVDPVDRANAREENASKENDVSLERKRTTSGRVWTQLDPSAVGELLGSHDVDALRVMKALTVLPKGVIQFHILNRSLM